MTPQQIYRRLRKQRAAAAIIADYAATTSGGAESISIANVSGILVASYSWDGTENNQLPYVEDITISGTEQEGEVITFTVTWLKNGMSGSLGASSLAIYRNDDLSATNATLIETQTSAATESLSGNTVTATYTYTLVTADVGKYLNVEFIPKLIGVQNTDGLTFTSQYTGSIASNLVLPSEYAGWDLALINGAFSGGSWVNLGTDGGSFVEAGTNPFTVNGDNSITSDGTAYLTGTAPSSTSAYSIAMKFTWGSNSEIKSIYELGNNKQIDVTTAGILRLKSTTSDNTTTIVSGTEYNLIAQINSAANAYIRIETNDGTLIFEDAASTAGNIMLAGQASTIFADIEFTNINDGTLWEFCAKDGVMTAGERTDILTRLKSL